MKGEGLDCGVMNENEQDHLFGRAGASASHSAIFA
jgi:hypothetical protein